MKRRSLLKSALLLPAASAATYTLRSEPASSRLFELGTVTYNLARSWDLDTLIANCEETGFSGVELRSTHAHGVEPEIGTAERRMVRQRFQQTPVKLVCLGSACEYHSPDREVVEQNIERTRLFLQLAADVGAPAVKVRPNGIPESVPVEDTLRQIGDALAECGRTGERLGVDLWVEVHGRDSSHPPYIKKMIDYAGSPRVAVTWNCNPTDLKEGRIEPYFELLREHIRNVHIRDLYEDYPYKTLFGLLRSSGYSGYTLAEIPAVEGDPIRFMHYYRRLWEELSAA